MKTAITFCLLFSLFAGRMAGASTAYSILWANTSGTAQTDGLAPSSIPSGLSLPADGIRRGDNATALTGTGGWGSNFSQTSKEDAISMGEYFSITLQPTGTVNSLTLKSILVKLKTTEAVYNSAELRYIWQYRITVDAGTTEPFFDIGQPQTMGPAVAAWGSAGNVLPLLDDLDETNRIVPRSFMQSRITLRLVVWRDTASTAAFPVQLGLSTQAILMSYSLDTPSPADRALAQSDEPFVPAAYLNKYTSASNALGGPSIISIPYPSEADPDRRRLIAAFQQQAKGAYIYTSNTNGSSWNVSSNHLDVPLGGTFLKVTDSPVNADAPYPWSTTAEFGDSGTIEIERYQDGSGSNAIKSVVTTTDDAAGLIVSKLYTNQTSASTQIRETLTVNTPTGEPSVTTRVTIMTTPVASGANITPAGGIPSPAPSGPNIVVASGVITTTQAGTVTIRETLRLTSTTYTETVTEEFSSIAGSTLIVQSGPTEDSASGHSITSAYTLTDTTPVTESYFIGKYAHEPPDGGVSIPVGLGRLFAAPKPTADTTGDSLTLYYLGTGTVKQGTPLVTVKGLVISKSTNSGISWSAPALIAPGEWDAAATNVWQPASGTHIYTVVTKEITKDVKPGSADITTQTVTLKPSDSAPPSVGLLAPVLLRAAVDSDLTQEASWTQSSALTFAGDVSTTGPTAGLPPLLPGYRENFGATRSDTYASFLANPVFPSITPAYPAIHQFGIPFFPQTFPYRGNMGPNEPSEPTTPIGWLEGHVVQITDEDHALYEDTSTTKSYHLFMRTTTGKTNYAAIAKVVEQGTTSNGAWQPGTMTTSVVKAPSFTVNGGMVTGKTLLFLPFPGGHQRFHVLYDQPDSNVPNSGYYWMVGSQAVDSMTKYGEIPDGLFKSALQHRYRMVLYFSKNMVDWCFAGVVAATNDPQQSRSEASMAVHGADLVFLARSADANASSAHDNNMITFHRVQGFRDLVY